MKIHEHQAKALLREFAVPVPPGDVATTPAEARAVAARLGGRVVVKAQVHAGGRGKAGGIKLADNAAAAEAAARQILGMRLRTPQTPPEGIEVRSVLVEEASAVERELYLSITLDRARSTQVAMASQAGGMEIEEVAARSPEKILREWAHPALGLADHQARRLAFGLGGCMVNGAGLAMATMDIIKLAGGEPANFLDVGGGASPEQIENAFRILSSDPSVKAVFINVFGGILRVDRLAEGLIAAVKTLGLRLPVVVRMEGTNVELGKKMLAESGLRFVTADDMGDGARKAVALAKGSR